LNQRFKTCLYHYLPQSKYLRFWILPAIILIAAFFRFYGLKHGIRFHPDENHIISTVLQLSFKDLNPHSFAYGSLPFYLYWFFSKFLSLFHSYFSSQEGLYVMSRAISALMGILGVYLTYVLSLKIQKNITVSLLSAFFLAINVFHVQLSHFCTVDILLVSMNLFVLIGALNILRRGSLKDYLLVGFLLGVSLAIKIRME